MGRLGRPAAHLGLLGHALSDLTGQVGRVELGHERVDALHETSRSRLLDVLGHRDQLHPGVAKRRPDGHVVLHGAGQPIDLVDDHRADASFRDPAEHGLQHRSVGGAGGLTRVGELIGQVPAALGHVAKARLALGGDRVPLAALVLVGLLLGGDPEVDHRVHRSSSSRSSATARSTSARASGPSAPGSGGSGLSSPGHASVARPGVVSGASRVSAEALPILSRRRGRSRSVLGASARRGVKGHVGAGR